MLVQSHAHKHIYPYIRVCRQIHIHTHIHTPLLTRLHTHTHTGIPSRVNHSPINHLSYKARVTVMLLVIKESYPTAVCCSTVYMGVVKPSSRAVILLFRRRSLHAYCLPVWRTPAGEFLTWTHPVCRGRGAGRRQLAHCLLANWAVSWSTLFACMLRIEGRRRAWRALSFFFSMKESSTR